MVPRGLNILQLTLPILTCQDKHFCQHRIMVFVQYAYQQLLGLGEAI